MAACSAGSNNKQQQQQSATMADCTSNKSWQQRLFGKHLVRCDDEHKDVKLPSDEATQHCKVLGLYFSFVDPGASCDEFTRHLVDLYNSVNTAESQEKNGLDDKSSKRLQVIHVLLWSNVQEVLDLDQSFRSHVAELPWLAIPSGDYERKVRDTRVN